MRQALVSPLSSLIAAVQAGDLANQRRFLSGFFDASEGVLGKIEKDTSKQANSLHSAIANVRAHPADLGVLQQERQNLIADIP